jgi:tetratricopeptide (TPR) repeat protein
VQDANYWINLSLAQYQQKQYQASIDSARHALTINPNLATAYNNIGAGYAGLQQWNEAIRNEREAVRLDPTLQIAQNNLKLYSQFAAGVPAVKSAAEYVDDSLVLNHAGRYNESIAAAQHALQLDPNMAEAWNNIAANNEALHRWDDAIAAAQKAIALKPDFQLAKNNLAWSISQKKLGIH